MLDKGEKCEMLKKHYRSLRRALRKIGKSGVGNVHLVQADIRIAFDRLFWPQSLHRVYSLFPIQGEALQTSYFLAHLSEPIAWNISTLSSLTLLTNGATL